MRNPIRKPYCSQVTQILSWYSVSAAWHIILHCESSRSDYCIMIAQLESWYKLQMTSCHAYLWYVPGRQERRSQLHLHRADKYCSTISFVMCGFNLPVFWQPNVWNINWFNLAQNRVQWRSLVSTIMNLKVPQKMGSFLNVWASVSV